MDYLSDILKDRLQRIASIQFQISKSISDDFNLSVRKDTKKQDDNGLFVTKSGGEIKSSISKDMLICDEAIRSLITQMEDKVREIGQEPDGNYKDSDDWYVKDWIGKIDTPKKYNYDQLYPVEENYNNANNPNCKKMWEFNELARKFICLQIEKKKLQTIVNVLQDDKDYRLTIEVAAKLGF